MKNVWKSLKNCLRKSIYKSDKIFCYSDNVSQQWDGVTSWPRLRKKANVKFQNSDFYVQLVTE